MRGRRGLARPSPGSPEPPLHRLREPSQLIGKLPHSPSKSAAILILYTNISDIHHPSKRLRSPWIQFGLSTLSSIAMDPIIRPATFTVPLSPATAQHKFHSQTQPDKENRSDAQLTHLEAALKRSITIVFWYKSDCAPIRLHEEVSTFPLFQLSQCAQLVADLGISPSSYVDIYNPHACTWEQQMISAVCVVESEQRLLFRMRQSLLDGLGDAECPGLSEEVSMQTHHSVKQASSKNGRKRGAPASFDDRISAKKHARTDAFPQSQPWTEIGEYHAAGAQTFPLPSPTSVSGATAPEISCSTSGPQPYVPQNQFVNFTPPMPVAPSSPSPALPSGPLLKKWPNDYTVYELSMGFRQMDMLIAQQPSLTQRSAFERVFGCRYVKSTVCRHRGVWRRAEKELRETYEQMGTDERAVWTEFLKRIEGGTGRSDVNGKSKTRQAPLAGEMTVVMAPQMVQMGLVPSEGVVAREKAPVMGSLGTPPPDLDENTLQEIRREGSAYEESSVASSSADYQKAPPHPRDTALVMETALQ
ncbi:uncharacterized protein FIBRA_02307 [Fibroporia radiculosa]|uniref:Uncharacterized protein n=1 Tax=Fibroporia radiculosa TaxID=599839 RepID=J4HUP8_9APHY|nr:uncharacterized protein FIBRA_02307 [Fibroporia radiculosa]CCM00277.1 predicted protein [Fibroporia radiculosa]